MPELTIDLGALYEDCLLEKALRGKGKEQDLALSRMEDVIVAIQDSGYTVTYHLGGLVGALNRDSRLRGRTGELKQAIGKVLGTVRRLDVA